MITSDDFRTQLEQLLTAATADLGVAEVASVLYLARRQVEVAYDLDCLERLRPDSSRLEQAEAIITRALLNVASGASR